MSLTARPPSQRSASHAAVRGLQLHVLRRLDGLLHGDHAGLFPGPGTEPAEARPYVVGDDVRRIDWTVTARMRETHVRDPIADHELELTLVVDTSASLAFGTARSDKRDVALTVTAAFAFLAARGGNRVGAVLGGDAPRVVPPRAGEAHALALLAAVREAGQSPTGRGELATTVERARRVARRRGMVVVVSDLLEPPGWERPLRGLAARHDTVVVEVVDPRELHLTDVGWITLVDPETGRRRGLDTADARVRERYARAAADQRVATARAVASARADHLVVRTDRDPLADLVRWVAARRTRRQVAGGRR